MKKEYTIFLGNDKLGTTRFEKSDAPMGVVFGEIAFTKMNIGYDFIKEYCQSNGIELATDHPEDKLISTRTIKQLKVKNNLGIEGSKTASPDLPASLPFKIEFYH